VLFSLRKGRWAFALTALFALNSWGQERLSLCAACHGVDGNSTNPQVPSIAGHPPLYIETQLVLFREELRKSEPMAPVVKGMKDAEIVELAGHFSRLPRKVMESGAVDPKLAQRARALAKKNNCNVCHLSDFSGQNQVPRLAGQREEYLVSEMLAYRDNQRKGGDTIMAASLYGVSDADIRALAHFLARSKPRGPAR
jgi:cytochrome c553